MVWSSVMFRAGAARQLDPFTRPEIIYAEDFDLYHRLRALGGIARLDEELTVYRSHIGGASQKHNAVMVANAARVLAETYAPIFGAEASAHAALVAAHVMACLPVPDIETLQGLAETVGRVHRHFVEHTTVDAETQRLIRLEYSRLWWRVIRTGVRAGRIGLRAALAVQPEDAPLVDRPPGDLLLSGLIGRGRAIRRDGAFDSPWSRT
jgi:hypothetical protein